MKTQTVIWARVVLAISILAAPNVAAAQHIINLSAGGAEQTYIGAPGSRAGTWLDHGTLGLNDARRDLVVGAPGGTTGRVYILFGKGPAAGAPLDTFADAIITGPASFGTTTAIGNITMTETGNTRNLAVGAPDAAGGRGAVYVFARDFETGDRLAHTSAVAVITGAANDRIGASLASADLNDDGYRELIIGAPGTDRVYVVYGGPGLASRDLSAGADSVIVGHPSNNAVIGTALVAGPVTPDGVYDVVIGEAAANSVYLVAGTPGVLLPARIDLPANAANPALRPAGVTSMFIGPDAGDEAGSTLVVADIDGNTMIDLVIGAPGGDGRHNSLPSAGEVYVLWNEQTATSRSLSQAGVVFYGSQATQRLGSLFQKGHVNRDTLHDLVFRMVYGAGGEVRLYYGRPRNEIGELVGSTRVVDFSTNPENRIFINDATSSLLTALFVFEVTGEGARDIIIADAAAASGAGQVFFAISPRMVPSPKNISVTLREGQTATTTVAIRNASPITLPWGVGVPSGPPWLSVSPAQGFSHWADSQTFAVQISAAALAPGSYSAFVTLWSRSHDLVMTTAVPVSIVVEPSRFLAIETPANGATLDVPFTVTGWAIDTGATTGTGVDRVDVYAVPVSGGSRSFLGTATYGQPRPAVGSTHGSRFTNSGFTLEVTHAPAGTFRIVAEARSTSVNHIWNRIATAPTVSIEGVPSTMDFNGDGFVDIVWQHPATRALVYWSMDGYRMRAAGALAGGQLPPGRWDVRAAGDMNGDSHPDLILQELATGEIEIWLMNRTNLVERRALSRMTDLGWRVVGAADFNTDGHIDLLFQHTNAGQIAVWLMNRTTFASGRTVNPSPVSDLDWQIIGAGDMNGDGHPDIVWMNRRTRIVTSWLMNGTDLAAAGMFSLMQASGSWDVRGVADLNGDGRLDLLWQDFSRGLAAAWLMDGLTFIEAGALNPSSVNGWQLGPSR
jgi:hypothetical protein